MKKALKRNILLLGVLLSGILGYGLRSGLYAVGVDAKGLLVKGHPLAIALWACTAAAALLVVLDGILQQTSKGYDFGSSLPAALGHILAASGILVTVLPEQSLSSLLMQLWKLAGMLSAPLLLWAAFSRTMGKRPFFGVYVVCSVFFALHLVNHYQTWCSDPQLQNYVFSFAAAMALMLFAYYQSAAAVGRACHRELRLTALPALYFCMAALANTQYLYLYLGGALWTFGCMCAPERKGEADGSS